MVTNKEPGMKEKIGLVVIIAALVILAIVAAILFIMKPSQKSTRELIASLPPEIPGQVIYIPFPVKIRVDGDLSDWDGMPSSFVDTGPQPSTDPQENGSFTFSVAADMDNFYITMQMPDKNIIAGKHGTNFWNEDSMSFISTQQMT